MKVKIINQQKAKRINLKRLRRYLQKVLGLLNISSKKITVILCDDKLIRGLNKKYLGKNRATDVIAFPLSDGFEPNYLGEVVVSLEQAVGVSSKLNLRWQDELMLYIIHGILHFCGFDDVTKKKSQAIQRKQKHILQRLEPKTLKIKL